MENLTFHTRDLAFAACLLAANKLPLLLIETPQRHIAVMVFSDTQQVGDSLEVAFRSGATVPAAAYHAQLRSLRRMIDARLVGGR